MAEDLLLVFLRDRDVPCPACAYNLRDLTTNHCPECGHGVSLRVELAERKLGAWVTLLVVSCLGAGMGVFLIAAIAAMSLRIGFADAVDDFAGGATMRIAALGFVGALPIAAGAWACRRRFIAVRSAMQWWIVAGVTLYVLGVYSLFFCAIGIARDL